MKKTRSHYHFKSFTYPTFIVSSILLFCLLIAHSLNAQNPKSAQWESVGGRKLLSGNHNFAESWTSTAYSRQKNLYWQGSFYDPEEKRNYQPWENTVKNSVAPLKGQITVLGPGNVALYQKGKGARIYMNDVETNARFNPWVNTVSWSGNRWDGTVKNYNAGGEFWGFVPGGKEITLNVSAIMSAYNNAMNTGEYAFFAPQEVEFEVWFFPREGGKVIAVKQLSDGPDKPVSEMPGYSGKPTVSNDSGNSLNPIADNHVYAYSYSDWNKANWGKYEILGAGWSPIGGEKRAYLKFDLSGIDPNSFNKAILKLYHYHTGGNNSVDLGVYRLLSDWNEGRGTYKPATAALPGELTWVSQPSIDQYPVVYFNPGPGVNKWVEVDITTLVKAWLTGVPNYGLVIKGGENLTGKPDSQYGFYSRESGEIEKQPSLVLSGSEIAEIDVPQNNVGNIPDSPVVNNAMNANTGTSLAPDISGDYEVTCVGSIIYKFNLKLSQSGNRFYGEMVRTNGSEAITKVEGTISSDGNIDFIRSTGNWRQHYLGKVVSQSGSKVIKMEGKFGNSGDERYDWNALALDSTYKITEIPTIPDISGEFEVTCIGGITFKFNLRLNQSGNRFYGEMVRTNGSEAITKVEGTVSSDGNIDFIRSTGNWRQHYLGKVVSQSGSKVIKMEGRFGNSGDERYDWNAVLTGKW